MKLKIVEQNLTSVTSVNLMPSLSSFF